MHADWTASQIALATQLRTHQVHYALQQLHAQKVIRWLPLVNFHALGLTYYGIYFSVSGARGSWDRLRQAIQRDPNVGWFSEFAGEFQAAIAIVVDKAWQAAQVFDQLVNRARISVIKKSFATRIGLLEVPRGYLSKRSYAEPRMITSTTTKITLLTSEEQRMLQCILTANFSSYREAARSLGIAHTTLDAFMKRARSSGLLLEPVFSLDPHTLGRSPFKLLISLRGDPIRSRAKVRAYLLKQPETHHLVDCFGSWDIEANVEMADSRSVAELIHAIYGSNEDAIDEVKSLMLMRLNKRFSVNLRDLTP
jgi:DNA-binding Lrp family transcriptional regulator